MTNDGAESWAQTHARKTGHPAMESLTDPGSCDRCGARAPGWGLRARAREAEPMLPNVGDVWEWEPLKPHARETVTVTDVRWNGEEWWIESEGQSGRRWNSSGRWAEATVLVTPADEL
jgi:hypothetical protein